MNLPSKSGKTLPIVAEFVDLQDIVAIVPEIALNVLAIYPGSLAIYPSLSEFFLNTSAIYPKSPDKSASYAAIGTAA